MSVELPKELQAGDFTRLNWFAINSLRRAGLDTAQNLQRLRDIVARRNRPEFDGSRLPFEAYLTPLYKYPPAEREALADTWWRTFKVRHGYVNLIKCEGCDDADEEGTTPVDNPPDSGGILVPGDVGADGYWIWVEATIDSGQNVTAATIKHAEKLLGTVDGWPNHPERSTDATKVFIPLARIRTFDDVLPAEIRQFTRDDIYIDAGGGGTAGWG